MKTKKYIAIASAIIIGLIFIVSGIGKLADQEATIQVLDQFALIPETLSPFLAIFVPLAEITIGIALIAGFAIKVMGLASLALITGFIVINIYMITNAPSQASCGCFGIFEGYLGNTSPSATIFLDIAMMALSTAIIMYYPGKFSVIKPWYRGKNIEDNT